MVVALTAYCPTAKPQAECSHCTCTYCLAGLLKTVNKDSFEVCLPAIMLRRQTFELSGGPEQRRQHTGIHRWRGREFIHFTDRTGGKLATFTVNLIATVSCAKDPCSVMSLQRFQTPSLSPGAGEVRKRTVVGESLHIRHLPDCSTAGREQIIVPHVPRTLGNDA